MVGSPLSVLCLGLQPHLCHSEYRHGAGCAVQTKDDTGVSSRPVPAGTSQIQTVIFIHRASNHVILSISTAGYSADIPALTALAAAADLVWTSSFLKISFRCRLTVFEEMYSFTAISLLVNPRATSSRT